MARVEAIFLFPERRCAPKAVDAVDAHAGGLTGDRKRPKKRQVTVLTIEGWRAAMTELAAQASPAGRRANIVVTGIDLRTTIGTTLRIGDASLRILGENEPCKRMDEVHPGLQNALKPELRAGVYGSIKRPGRIRIGDPIVSEESPPKPGPRKS
jgi:MOSC domain-containing protein YiiM